jgi:hypothetical protein
VEPRRHGAIRGHLDEPGPELDDITSDLRMSSRFMSTIGSVRMHLSRTNRFPAKVRAAYGSPSSTILATWGYPAIKKTRGSVS